MNHPDEIRIQYHDEVPHGARIKVIGVGGGGSNAVNRMVRDFSAAAKPKWCKVTGQFATRGGMHSTITAVHGKPVIR